MTIRASRRGLSKSALSTAIAAALFNAGVTAAFAQQSEDRTEDRAPPSETNRSLEEIVVTGTRIRRPEFSSPNAVTVVTADDMKNLGLTSVASMVSQLPTNVGSITPETTGDSAFFVGSTIANLRGLNTFFGTRTLTLVDSRRFVATNNGGSVDLNFIPSALVGRIETVTGGASASYGSDALAGVVNVILDQEIQGVRLDVNYGETGEGDGVDENFSLAGGFDMLDGRAHFTVGVDHDKQDEIHDCTTRDYCRDSRGIIQNGSAQIGSGFFARAAPPYSIRNSNVTEPGREQFIIEEGMRYAIVPQGVFWGDNGGAHYTFNDAGNDVIPIYENLTPEQLAYLESEGVYGDTPYGAGPLTYENYPLLPGTNRDNVYTRFAYDFSGNTKFDVEVSYGNTDSSVRQNTVRQSLDTIELHLGNVYRATGNFTVPIGNIQNAFVLQGSPALQAVAQQQKETVGNLLFGQFGCYTAAPYKGFDYGDASRVLYDCVTVNKEWAGQLDRLNETDTTVKRVALGANGKMFTNWTWDTYFQYGFSDRGQQIGDYPSSSRRQMAYDAVIDQNTGEITCSVLSTDAAGDLSRQLWMEYLTEALNGDVSEAQRYFDGLAKGCAPLNPFGLAMSPEARAYAFPSIVEGTETTQKATSFTFSGDFWKGVGAGPFRMAAGIDANETTTRNSTGGDLITARDFLLNYGDQWSGRTRTLEPFVELELPVLRDRLAANYLMFNLADRRSQNKTERLSGDPAAATRYETSWKASMVWQPIELMRLRFTRSSDTRAPAPRELYQTNTPSLSAGAASQVQNPFRGSTMAPPGVANPTYDDYRSLQGGNASLDEETAINETYGIVFTPPSFPGLQVSVDYYKTSIEGGIENVFATTALSRCFDAISTGVAPEDDEYCSNNVVFGPPDPNFPDNPYSNIVSLSSSQDNQAPYWSRGIDFTVSYFTQLARGGALSARVMATRYLEQSVDQGGDFGRQDVSGQTGSNGLNNVFGNFGINYSPTPNLSSNAYVTYSKNAYSLTGQVRYVGPGRLNVQDHWIGPGEVGYYTDRVTGEIMGPFPYDPTRDRTVTDATLPGWATFNLNFNYDFGRSRFSLDRFDNLSAYVNITNLLDRVPDFFSGTSAGGINTTYFSGLGRQYRVGVRMEF